MWGAGRWYDAMIGRWISEDGIGFAGDPSNIYRYVHNSPTNFVDPSGLVGPGIPIPPLILPEPKPSSTAGVSSDTLSPGVSPLHQACTSFANGAGIGAIWDASPFGEIGQDATAFGNEWQQEKGGDWGNAARHAYWQAMLACEYGEAVAKAIGDAHECGQECTVDSRVDQFNNNVARQIGAAVGKPCDKEKIRKAVEDALRQGKFITDQKNDPRIPPAPKGCN